jgi:hypothetical protein
MAGFVPNKRRMDGIMKFKTAVLMGLALALGACSSASKLLDTKQMAPQGQVATNSPLSLPPDLQLPAPGTATAAAYQAPPAVSSAPLKTTVPANNLYGTPVVPAKPVGDVFDQNGISKLKPDGTKKTAAELNHELSLIYLAKKRQTNPSYGTVGNIGAIFNDN